LKEGLEGEREVSDDEWDAKNRDEVEGEGKLNTDDSVKAIENDVAGGDDVEGDDHPTEAVPKGPSEYERNKAKNIAELKRELSQLNERYPLPEELKRKPEPKKAANKSKTQDEEVVRRESPRNKSE
jgi:hypothetical protein